MNSTAEALTLTAALKDAYNVNTALRPLIGIERSTNMDDTALHQESVVCTVLQLDMYRVGFMHIRKVGQR